MALEDEVYRYSFNLFAFPEDYFEKKTAEELGISEDARKILITKRKELSEQKGEDRNDAEFASKQRYNALVGFKKKAEDAE